MFGAHRASHPQVVAGIERDLSDDAAEIALHDAVALRFVV
jgi:hypothetical protein